MMTTMKNWDESSPMLMSRPSSSKAMVSRAKSMGNQSIVAAIDDHQMKSRATTALPDFMMSPRGSRDSDEAAVKIRSKIEHLNQEYKFLSNHAAETKHSVAEMKEQLKLIVSMLEKQQILSEPKEFPHSQHTGTSHLLNQVPISNLEQNHGDSQLGYRVGDVKTANSDNVNQDSKMPMFNGKNLDDWIKKVEGFFSFMGCGDEIKLDLVHFCFKGDVLQWFRRVIHRKRFKVWDDFKQELRNQFGHVPCSPVELNLEHAQFFSRRNVHESDMVEKPSPAAETVSVQFDDCPVHNCSSQTVMLRNDSHHESDQTIADEVTLDVEEFSTTISHETKVMQVAHSVFLDTESIEEVSVNSTPVITLDALQDTVVSHLQTVSTETSCCVDSHEAVQIGDNEPMQEMQKIESSILQCCSEKYDAENVTLLPHCTVNSQPYFVHRLCDHKFRQATSKKKQMKWVKTWKFKFKKRQCTFTDRVKSRGDKNLKTRWMSVVCFWSKIWRTFIYVAAVDVKQERGSITSLWSHCLHMIKKRGKAQRSMLCDALWNVKWRRVPFIVVELKHRKLQEEYNVFYWTLMRQHHILMCKMQMKQTLQRLEHFKFDDGKFKVQHKWRFKQLKQDSVLSFGLTKVVRGIWPALTVIDKRIRSLLDHIHYYMSLEQRGIVWLWFCSTKDQSTDWEGLMLMDGDIFLLQMISSLPHDLKLSEASWWWFCFGLQPHRSSQQSSLLFLLKTSLWASLFSKAGVYSGILTCLLIVEVLFELLSLVWKTDVLVKYLRKRSEGKELLVQFLLQEFGKLTHEHQRKGICCFKKEFLQ